MTAKEAIEVLSEIYMHVTVDSLEATIMVERHNKALDMAIEALEAQDMTLYMNLPEASAEEVVEILKRNNRIELLPPEDVQPVVHGKWIPVTAIYKVKEDQFPQTERVWVDATEPDEIDAVKCSVCGEVFDFADARNWCTQCGAKIDKRKGADDEVN